MSITLNLDTLLDVSPMRITQPKLSDTDLLTFCAGNSDIQIERDANGEIVIMSPTNSESGIYSGRIFRQIDEWSERFGGYAFDSSAGFTLPNGAMRAPDSCWVAADRWEALSEGERNSFAPLCPDLVVELMSKSDRLPDSKQKMSEYIDNGANLGFLIDRKNRIVYVYRPDSEPEELTDPIDVSGEPVMRGFTLKMARLF